MKTAPSFRRVLLPAYIVFCALLVSVASFAAEAKPALKRLLIVGQGSDGHPATTHEFMPGAKALAGLLKAQPGIQCTVVNGEEPWAGGPELIDKSDGVALFVTQGAQWMQSDAKRYEALQRLAKRGGAITAFHWSVGAKDEKYIAGQLALLGGTRGGPQRKYKVLEVEMKRVNPKHPILTGLTDLKVFDEFYYALDLQPDIQPLYQVNIDGKDETCAWGWARPDGGRSFGFVALHFHSNWQLPEYRRLVVQGVLWSLKLPIPDKGVSIGIDRTLLELDGVLPPPAGPDVLKKPAKKQK
ncbi:MAG TPA: ThuA domain-containing protein [Roseimicrobium sp.]|nr:ThuA domain-containing protein [Roseimicrobium sp.]